MSGFYRLIFVLCLAMLAGCNGCQEAAVLGEPDPVVNINPDPEPEGQPDPEPEAEPNAGPDADPDPEPDDGLDCEPEDQQVFYPDADGDGFGNKRAAVKLCVAQEGMIQRGGDCDDNNAAINPDAIEICDGVDNNCDPNDTIDGPEEAIDVKVWFRDADGDEFGDTNASQKSCGQPEGHVLVNGDCNDTNPQINPGADLRCGDDHNCDGEIDDAGSIGSIPRYLDGDNDGFGLDSDVVSSCEPLEGRVDVAGDCNDNNEDIKPGAPEICDGRDNNCNDEIDAEFGRETLADGSPEWRFDADGDGHGVSDDNNTIRACERPAPFLGIAFVDNNTDCDDQNNRINPDVDEVCDGIDNNCNQLVDDEERDPDNPMSGSLRLYPDADSDGFGDEGGEAVFFCELQQGLVQDNTDCDDERDDVNPGEVEICNDLEDLDEDCDDRTNDGTGARWYEDCDGDGHGLALTLVFACDQPDPVQRDDRTCVFVALGDDCDDENANRFPGNVETCDELDRDCDPNQDPFNGAEDTVRQYFDLDRDTFGDPNNFEDACVGQHDPLTVNNALDCNDRNEDIKPGAIEVCDGVDNNCQDGADESTAQDALTFYLDQDGDTFGSESHPVRACVQPDGTADRAGDCRDLNEAIHPDADEICNLVDDNCDDLIDDADPGRIGGEPRLVDGDNDGFGVEGISELRCALSEGFTHIPGDCNDEDANINPRAEEVCDDGVDNDCDDIEDLGDEVFPDADGDGFGNGEGQFIFCGQEIPSDVARVAGDCDDDDAERFPGNEELCDEKDRNCDGDSFADATDQELFYLDRDGDGFGDEDAPQLACAAPAFHVSNILDCDDTRTDVRPGVPELCATDFDDNCNGLINEPGQATVGSVERFEDLDGDGFGNAAEGEFHCEPVIGRVDDDTDCDDRHRLVNPNAPEICDTIDNNCNGDVDDDDEDLDDLRHTRLVFTDGDGDRFGLESEPFRFCVVPDEGFATQAGDCNDGDANINPGVAEVCANNIDDDCDGDEDGGDTIFPDRDNDGFGIAEGQRQECGEALPRGFSRLSTDCNDADAEINPDAEENCADVDRNCDGNATLGAVDTRTFFLDGDGDGHGDPERTQTACAPDAFFIAEAGDCNDADRSVNPVAAEDCSEVDRNCDGDETEGAEIGLVTFSRDLDQDGFGDVRNQIDACVAPPLYVLNDEDCDDGRRDINPDAIEICDELDNNCNTQVDDADPELNDPRAALVFADSDGDGFGVDELFARFCIVPRQGFAAQAGDCDDDSADINPGELEVCANGVDDNCDDIIDEGQVVFADGDGDGFGAPGEVELRLCDEELPPGFSTLSTDCNDADPAINPDADELCTQIDENCDGDRFAGAIDPDTFVHDGDQDGFGANGTQVEACGAPLFFVLEDEDAFDCNDTDPQINPNATEDCSDTDRNCDGRDTFNAFIGLRAFHPDFDRDGFGASIEDEPARLACEAPANHVDNDDDCDDSRSDVNPEADEVCDGVDNNCNGDTDDDDEDLDDPQGTRRVFEDNDGDNFGVDEFFFCVVPDEGFATQDGDCDDGDANVNPGVAEVCANGVDDDCDGNADDGDTIFPDRDGDGFGTTEGQRQECGEELPPGFSLLSTDCNDADENINPGADELCTEIDENCDGSAFAGAIDQREFFLDGDGDGHGDPERTQIGCEPDQFFIAEAGDCDDANREINPNAAENCDPDEDRNCDGNALEGAEIGLTTFSRDRDGDGFGDAGNQVEACEAPALHVSDDTDCDDSRSDVNPEADEVCDGVDNNCNGDTDDDDEDLDDPQGTRRVFEDNDGDNFGVDEFFFCVVPDEGFATQDGDCDDGDANVNPGELEVCANGVDDNCDDIIDEGQVVFADSDGDGFGAPGEVELRLCDEELPPGFSTLSTDCNDADPAINPNAEEDCAGADLNCDGLIEAGATIGLTTFVHDGDGDGFGADGTQREACNAPDFFVIEPSEDDQFDCNDGNENINPGVQEDCDTPVDDNCSGDINEDGENVLNTIRAFPDTDGDGFGVRAGRLDVCVIPDGFAPVRRDCEPDDDQSFPGATEICDDRDNDCNGEIDEELPVSEFLQDSDGDGFGDEDVVAVACRAPEGFIPPRDDERIDCNDSDELINPDAGEICDNEVDENCDDIVAVCEDPNDPEPQFDEDGDGLCPIGRDLSDPLDGDCNDEGEDDESFFDCDDTTVLINSLATEACDDDLDLDCDGLTGEDDPDAQCLGTLTVTSDPQSGDLVVVLNGDVSGTLINDPDLGGDIVRIEVGVTVNDCFDPGSDCGQTDFLGDNINHTMTFAQGDFTPRIETDGAPVEQHFIDLLFWDVLDGNPDDGVICAVGIDEFRTGLIVDCDVQ